MLLLAKVEDFPGSDGRPDAVPVRVIKKIEIFFLIEKLACLVRVAGLERDGANVHVSQGIPEGLQGSARARDIAPAPTAASAATKRRMLIPQICGG